MATWSSPRSGAYRDASPTSPLPPLSPGSLPQWLRAKRSRPSYLSNSKIRLGCAALTCLLLGSMFTWTMGPTDEVNDADLDLHDLGSGGVLSDPSGFGMTPEQKQGPSVEPHDHIEQTEVEVDETLGGSKDTSVSGALSDLHHAVSSKLQTWSPYHNPGAASQAGAKGNKAGKKPNGALTGEEVKDGISEEDRLGARTRVGKCTIVFNSNTYWERAIKTHEQHDKLHGYRLHVLRQSLMDDVWSKPAYILSLLLRELAKPESERLEWLLWVDADTIILNPYISIETFLPPPGSEFDDVHLMYSNDWNGLNNGVFPVRVNQWAVQLFSAITSYRHYRPDEPLTFRDQSAMNALMQEPAFSKHLVQAPQRWFNAYQGEHNETLAPFQIRRGDLLVHFAGVPDREHRMGYWLDRAEQHLEDWEIPVRSTSYPQEARDFWAEQTELRKNRKSSMAELRVKATEILTKTDNRLTEYGERLTDDERNAVGIERESLEANLEDPSWQDHPTKLEEAVKSLQDASGPLNRAIVEANKVLLTSAHEAIFSAEKDLFEGGFDAGVRNPEMHSISDAVKRLKNLVISPEEHWSKADILRATNEVNEARAKYQEKIAVLAEAERMKVGQADAHRGGDATAALAVDPMAFAAPPAAHVAAHEGIAMPTNVVVIQEVITSVQAVQVVAGPVVTITPEAVMLYATASTVVVVEAQETAT